VTEVKKNVPDWIWRSHRLKLKLKLNLVLSILIKVWTVARDQCRALLRHRLPGFSRKENLDWGSGLLAPRLHKALSISIKSKHPSRRLLDCATSPIRINRKSQSQRPRRNCSARCIRIPATISSSHSTFVFAPHRSTTLSATQARNPARSEVTILRHEPCRPRSRNIEHDLTDT
jgi:hypothetical protein